MRASRPPHAAAGDAIRLAGAERDSREYDVHLPAASILSAVLITGVDAPTGLAARREPFPIMARKTAAMLSIIIIIESIISQLRGNRTKKF